MRPTAAPPKWLTTEEMAAWRALIGIMHRLPIALDSQLRRDAGITHFDYAILVSLADAPNGACTMSDLADLTASSLSRLSHAMRRLGERGWTSRSPLASDGRITEARITAAGRRKLASAAPGHVDEARRLVIDALTPNQVRSLATIGASILERVDEAGACDPHHHSLRGGIPAEAVR